MPFLSPKLNKRSWFRFVVEHPYLIISLVMIVSLAFGWKLPDLRFQTSIYDLTIEDLPETKRYEDFKTEFGCEELILVVIRTEYVFDPVTFRQIGLLSEKLSGIKGVTRVVSLPVIKRDMDVTDKWSLVEFDKIITPIDLFHQNLISEDKSRTVITLILDDIKNKGKIVDSVEKIIDHENDRVSLYQIGMPVVFEALAKYTQKDFFALPPITLLVIGIVLFFLFHSIRGVLLPIGSVLLCLVWTFGLMAWLNIPLSILTMIVPIFLIAVGTAYCMYVVSEYMDACRLSETSKSAVLQSFSNISLPTSLAVFTTIVGLCSLLVNKIYAIQEFALFSCFGLLSCLVIIFSFLPACMTILSLPGNDKEETKRKRFSLEHLLEKIIRLNLNHQKMTLSIISGIILLAIWGVFQIRIETNPVDFFKRETPVSQHFYDIYQDMSGSFPINVVLDSELEDYFEDPENIAKLLRLQDFLNSLDGVDKTISFAEYLKLINYATNQNKKGYYRLPIESFEVRMLVNDFKSMLGDDMLKRFMSEDFSKANILLRTHISNSSELVKTKQRMIEHLQMHYARDFNFEITGVGVLISQTSNTLTKSQIKSLSFTLAIVFIIMFLLFVSSKVSFVALVPNCFPILINFGLMGWLGIELSLVTCLIASIAIGLAVDDTIHYLVTYRREVRKDLNKNRALHDTVMRVGKPIVFTTLAISLGFSILMFSHFKPTAIFGLMMVVTMFAALVADLILLPSLMFHVELVTPWDVLKMMKPLGGISLGIAHELNQPLNAIKMGSEFLKMMLMHKENIPDEHLNQVVNEIDRQVDRASKTVNRLRDFDQQAAEQKEETDVNINDSITNVLAVLGHQFTLQNIELNLDLDESIPVISAHPNRLEQVVYNLLVNAKESIIKKQNSKPDGVNCIVKIATFSDKNAVAVSISDTGTGIPKNMHNKIFEPFFTCDETACSIGLGLSITYGIVKGYRGKVKMKSKEGVGSTFTVSFPFS